MVCRFKEDEECKSPGEQSPLLDGKSEKYIIKKLKHLNISLEKIDLYLKRLEVDPKKESGLSQSSSSPNFLGFPERKRMRQDELHPAYTPSAFVADYAEGGPSTLLTLQALNNPLRSGTATPVTNSI